jgi:hypothetical protein
MSSKIKIPYGQDLFFRCLINQNYMNELIQRFYYKNKLSFLYDLIKERNNKKLPNIFTINTKFTFDTNGNHSVFINYWNKNNIKIFHASLHLCPDNFSTPNTPLHFRENNPLTQQQIKSGKKHTLLMEICNDPNQVNGIKFCIGQYVNNQHFIDTTLEK